MAIWMLGTWDGRIVTYAHANAPPNFTGTRRPTREPSPTKPPTAPQNLKAVYDQATKMVTFSWDAASDDVTPQEALQYNPYLKKSGSDNIFMTVPADVQTGFIKTGRNLGTNLDDRLLHVHR